MKAGFLLLLFGSALDLFAQGQSPVAASPPPVVISPYAVAQRSPHHRLWQQVTSQTNFLGQTIYRTNSYQELATGLCYWNGAQWSDSTDQIQLTPNGAAATNSQHQVFFAANINTAGAINLTTPDGRQMTSRILGLVYTDATTTNSVLFADTQDSIGLLLPSGNQVIYTNAFANTDCDVLYTHRLNGFEQDIVIRQQLPSPASVGLTGSNIWLQVWTEFTAALNPQVTQLENGDSSLDFGVMKMRQGNAFMLGDESVAVPVFKEWLTAQGRTFLVESVPLSAIAASISQLPSPSGSSTNSNSIRGTSANTSQSDLTYPRTSFASLAPPHPHFNTLKLPPPRLAKKSSATMQLAGAQLAPNGLVLDYNLVNGSQTNFTFQGDTTYYVSNEVDLYGTTVIEGGTVIKYSKSIITNPAHGKLAESSSAMLVIWDTNLVWNTGSYRPVIFSGQDDDSIGTQIKGSTGTPGTNYYGHLAIDLAPISNPTVSNVRFSYMFDCLLGSSVLLRDAQAVNCYTLFDGGLAYSYDGYMYEGSCCYELENVLLNQIAIVAALGPGGAVGNVLTAVNVTAHDCGKLMADGTSQIYLTNCLFANFTNWQSLYNYTNYVVALTNDTGVFQTVGAGSHYLATNSPYTNYGTTNIDPALLADLAQKTTWPPLVLSNQLVSSNTTLGPQAIRDTNSQPDLGYHYTPLDYIVDDYMVTNATLTVTNAAIACDDDSPGIWLQGNSSLVSIGTPLSPNWFTLYQMVQEQSVTVGSSGASPEDIGYIVPYAPGAIQPNGTYQFTKFSGGSALMLCNADPQSYSNLLIQECEFWAGGCMFYGSTNPGATTVIDNSLFVRSLPNIEVPDSGSVNIAFSNNLVWCATFKFWNSSVDTIYAYNNIFDTCLIHLGLGSPAISNGYNAYLNCTNRLSPTNGPDNAFDIVSNTSLAYQSGPLGDFYQPADSPLLYMGSTNASLVGLYEYTTQTNEVKEATNMVSIGYHYVTVGTNGNPDSTLWLGIPDYLVDSEGDGVTNLVAWQLEYFGYTGLNPFADPYNQGTNLLQDYESGADLTQISFSLASTNNYVATNLVPITVNVSAGIPYYMAVLVDNTNLASATWSNYTSSVMVNLGTNQGWHQVWVGVSALPTNALPIWQAIRLNLDLTPPQIVITSPSNSTTFLPEIQVLGYSPGPLASLSYDVTNAAGALSNQLAYVSSQFYDTNIYAFTTNFFQLYDIDLTNGVNTIFIHATDQAGNTTTTNVSFTFDLSGDTNAPVITLFWPQNNGQVSGTNFTLRGSVDNPTAFITAQIVDTNGDTNLVNGIVERNGNFWVENLPLAPGTNVVTLIATDAATNSMSTNINVIGSSLQLSIDAIEDGQLSNAPVTVTGEINSSDYTVWVNGVEATLNGDGTWSAYSVPFNSGGTAVIEARAIPNTDNGGNGTADPNAGNPSVADPGNPSSAGAVDATVQPVVAPYYIVTSYYYTYSLGFAPTTPAAWPTTTIATTQWTTNGGSYYEVQVEDDGAITWYDHITYDGSSYPPSTLGDEESWSTGGTTNYDATTALIIPWLRMGDGQVDTLVSGTNRTSAYVLYNAGTQISLVTGGKGASHRQDLFAISGTATPMIWQLFGGIGVLISGPTNASPTSITMGSLGQLGTDGIRWIALEENTTRDATPAVSGVQDYSFTAGAVHAHH